MALHHPAYGNPAVICQKFLDSPSFNPRTSGELKADVLDRDVFDAHEMTFASSHKKIVITADMDDFGSIGHRSVAFTLDVNIQSGIYLFKRGAGGPVREMSYTECVKNNGEYVYHLIQAEVGSLQLSVVESCYSARLFTFDGCDHNNEPFEICGDFIINPPHASFNY